MEFTDLKDIPADFDPNEVLGVFNPLPEAFTCLFGGVEKTLEAGQKKTFPKHLANHIAKHLADKICRDRHVELLQLKFEGLDESGREKWRTNEQILVTRADVQQVKETLLYEVDGENKPKIAMPATRFDGPIVALRGKGAKTRPVDEDVPPAPVDEDGTQEVIEDESEETEEAPVAPKKGKK